MERSCKGATTRESSIAFSCDEICDALGVPRNSVMRLKRACYGLVDAPLEWYRSVAEFLEGLGLERTWSDPCTWVWRVPGRA